MELTKRAKPVYSIMGDDHSLTVFILLSPPITTTTRYHNSNRFHVTIITIFLGYLYRVNKKNYTV